MKLGPKMLAAPLATALVVLAAGQLNSWLLVRDAGQNRTAFQDRLSDFKTVASVQEQRSVAWCFLQTIGGHLTIEPAKVIQHS